MRDHKYRYWDEANKAMVYFTLGELLASYNDEGDYPAIAETDLFRIHQDIDTKKVMDSIGLLDRQGKEVYEGDIVQFQTYDAKGIVNYIAPRFHASGHELRGYEFEIIGNIYERSGELKTEHLEVQS